MEILQRPDNLSLLGNLKSFLISSLEEVNFALYLYGEDMPLLQESYTPDANGNIAIDIREICGQYLKTMLPTDNEMLQSEAVKTFTAKIGATSYDFSVANAAVRNLSLSAADYLRYNFLTLQPQSKQVTWHSPEYLTYYFTVVSEVKAKFYLKSGDTETITVATIFPTQSGSGDSGTIQLVDKIYSINVTLSRLFALSSYETDELQGFVDVWVEAVGAKLSYIQRYIYTPSTGEEHHYLAVNSLGGIDTFTFISEQLISGEIEHQTADSNGQKITITSEGYRKYKQNTGYLGGADSEWLWEFLHSKQHWVVAGGVAEDIAIVSSSLSKGDMSNLNINSFEFVLAREGGLLPATRRDETFPDIMVPSPVSDLFFLSPRIIDFPAANPLSELVLPVQTPHSNAWLYLTLSALLERISPSGSNHTHRNISILQAIGDSDGKLTYKGIVIGAGGISLPIAISDVIGLREILNDKASTNHTHPWSSISNPPRFVDFDSEQTVPGLKHLHHIDAVKSLAVPQSAPPSPREGLIYEWLAPSGNYSETPGGGVATVYDLTIKAGQITLGIYQPGIEPKAIDLSPLIEGLASEALVRQLIATAIASAIKFQGISTTELTDGGTQKPTIDGQQYNPSRGDVVLYSGFEFLWTGAKWQKLGDETSYALKTILIQAGSGLTGGGDLTQNRTIALSDATIAKLDKAETAVQPAALDSYLPLSAGQNKALTGHLYTRNVLPSSDKGGNLGSSTNRYAALYCGAVDGGSGDMGFWRTLNELRKSFLFAGANKLNIGEGYAESNLPTNLFGSVITLHIGATKVAKWQIDANGNLLPYNASTDVNLGASAKRVNNVFAKNTDTQTLNASGLSTLADADVTGSLAIPTSAPSNPVAGKYYEWINLTGNPYTE